LNDYVFGVEWLDKNFSDLLKLKPLILIAGCPGSGKTVLACTISYANALRGHKVLYITFHESKEKLFKIMSGLGMSLSDVEVRGTFKFVRIPLPLTTESLNETISKLISEYSPEVVVFDTINPILTITKDESVKRALLQNFFYELSGSINGMTILVAESGGEDINLGNVEFIADAVFILKQKVSKGLVSRSLMIKKVRGVDVSIAEIPFRICGNLGLVLYPPPILEEVSTEYGELGLPCEVLRKVIGHIHKSMPIYITYPPDARSPHAVVIPLSIALLNNLKVLFVSYIYPRDILKSQLIRALSLTGLKSEEVRELIDKYVVVKSINPTAYSLDELYMRELRLVESVKDLGVVVFHDVGLVAGLSNADNYLNLIYNQLNYLRLKGLLTIRLGSYVSDEIYRLNSLLSSMVLRFEPVFKDGRFVGVQAYVWRRGTTPYIITSEELSRCFEEIAVNMRRRCLSR
jgi:circadian clock protein KaiC